MCTNIVIKAKDGSVVVARSMDFASPTGQGYREWTFGERITAEHKVLIPFRAKFSDEEAFRCVSDGYNNRGLSIGSLWLPSTKFESGSAAFNSSVDGMFLLQILLGNCANVSEAVTFLQNHKVLLPSKYIERFATVHLHLVDKTGASKVVEFGTDGVPSSVHVYDNPIGVMTNAPEFPWHVTNLRNFAQIGVHNVEGKTFKGISTKDNDYTDIEMPRTGFGSNQLGLAGDASPPSRFVRAVTLLNAAIQNHGQPADAKAAILLADKVMGQVTVIKGTSADRGKLFGEADKQDYTQWVWIKVLNNYGADLLKTDGDYGFSTPKFTEEAA